jgi:SPW repeat
MATIRLLKVHRTWEDWLGIGIGLLIGLAPLIAGQADSPMVVYNAALVGVLVLALAAFEMVGVQRWEEGAEIACGLWLIASPFVFDYAAAGALRYWHFVLGAIVVVLATFELWQDWKLSDSELAHHGL